MRERKQTATEVIPSPNRDPKKPRSSADVERGRRLALEAWRWMERNEAIYLQMIAFVRDLKRRGVKGRVRDQIAIHFTKLAAGKGTPMFTLRNGIWAGVSRYMVMEDPTLDGDPIHLARSAIDDHGLFPVSWMGNRTGEGHAEAGRIGVDEEKEERPCG